MLMRIRDFASLCQMSVRALHLYDEINLFSPAHVDPDNGYRYYDSDQLHELENISSLRKLGFSLKEIHILLDARYSRAEVIKLMLDKRTAHEKEMEMVSAIIDSIDKIVRGLERVDASGDDHTEFLKVSMVLSSENDLHDSGISQIIWL